MRFLKTIAAAALLAICTAPTVTARDTEVGFSYGAMPAMKNIDAYNGGWDGISPWGAVSMTIDHRFASRLKAGLSYTLSTASTDHTGVIGGGDITWHALMVNARYDWMEKGRWRLYSHAGAGVLITYFSPSWRDSYNTTRFAFQASPLGAEFDIAPSFGLFAEAGYGIEGIVQAGFRIGF